MEFYTEKEREREREGPKKPLERERGVG